MKIKNTFIIPFLGKENKSFQNSLIVISLSLAAGIGYYLIKKNRDNKRSIRKNNKPSAFKRDMRMEIKNSTKDLLGVQKDRKDLIQVQVPEAGTLNWKKSRTTSVFPPIPDPNIRIN